MMKKFETLNHLVEGGIIAVVRGKDEAEAIQSVHAVVEGGITGIELTFTVPHADRVIAELVETYKNRPEVVVGAGTVLDAATARLAIIAGAQFIVSPTYDAGVAEISNLYQIPYTPGTMTITEIQTALKTGADIVKLFPGSAYGPSIIKAFKGPFPDLNIMPTGGVSLDNMEEWFAAGVVAVGVGGNLLAPAATGDFAQVTAIAKQYSQKLKEIRSK
jgi:2-dehydro-3-deoxyphosphogluconate aldolase/(4S)-4-hydroxy-2-oxoglutarate aldolase